MIRKNILLLKDFFFKFNSAFLSSVLEENLKSKKIFSQMFFFLRKQIVFYSLCFLAFSLMIANSPFVAKSFWDSLNANTQLLRVIFKFGMFTALFVGMYYLTQVLKSNILRTADFFIARVQVAHRYLTKESEIFEFVGNNTSHLLKFIFSALAIVPLTFLYYSLFSVLGYWILAPIFATLVIISVVGYLKINNAILLKKSEKSYKKEISFFSTIEKYLSKIRLLGFNEILQKKILNFSGNSVLFYQKIFENEIKITGIKYCGVFLLFSINSGLFIFNSQKNEIANFLPVLLFSCFISTGLLAFLKTFDYFEGAKKVFGYLKSLDSSLAHDVEQSLELNEENLEYLITFKEASFVKNKNVVFHQMSHQIKSNKLIALIGSTHEERSNYLNACIGKLTKIGGQVQGPETYEFLSKKSIIFDGNIRENIIQFHDFDPVYYEEVLKACALSREIALLPESDLTKLDQNHKNFAPDFLRKIAIARIVYAKCSVNIFDEPFLHLSLDDATQIFYEAFQKLLNGTSRIFCTDKTEFAALSDEILVCKSGKIIEQGTHVNLLTYDTLYSRLFYAGAEHKRYEIIQSHSKYHATPVHNPLTQEYLFNEQTIPGKSLYIFGDQIFEKFKQQVDRFSYFMKMFFPVFVSKNFYAFFTFLTVTVWAGVYSFYFIVRHLELTLASKTAILFFSFSLIACVSFSVMLVFYKQVFSACAYIVENVSKFYFASVMARSDMPRINWKEEHILSVTGKFFKHFLNFLLIGFFCISSALLLLTLPNKFLMLGVLSSGVCLLFAHTIIKNNLFFDDEDSIYLNNKFKLLTADYFDAYQETQSKNVHLFLLEKTQAKIYSFFFKEKQRNYKKTTILHLFGFHELWWNYHVIEEMVTALRMDQSAHKPKLLSHTWPSQGSVVFEKVKFNSGADEEHSFSIPSNARFISIENSEHNKSILIEKLRSNSSIFAGTIKVDGEDIAQMNRNLVRRAIGYIAQSAYVPYLTVREHIDPFEFFDDSEVWDILTKIGLSQRIALLKNGLSSLLEELPEEMVLSGEIVLLAFARCLLNQNKIICIDALDVSEDIENQICSLIKSDFLNTTVIFASDNEKFKTLCSIIYPENIVNKEQFITIPEEGKPQSYLHN